MSARWAIDFGTTNTVVALAGEENVRVVHLPGLAREQPSQQSPLVPTAVDIRLEERHWYWRRRGIQRVQIGQQALNRNYDGRSPGFAQGFKRYLGDQPHRPALRVGIREFSVREIAQLFLRELLLTLRRQFRERVVDLTIPAPVGSYEPYRAELKALVQRLGICRFQSLDEPVAAALGYGVNPTREETLLVVDFGGGTLNLAVLRLGPQTTEAGAAPVLAKHMLLLGGDDVDRWLMERLVPIRLLELPDWQQDVRWEAMRLKEEVSREGEGEFRWSGLRERMTREELTHLLAERGLYGQLHAALGEVQRQLREETPSLSIQSDPSASQVGQVLLVGGSTLLPEVPTVVDDAFPQAVVRHDPALVFTAVALGAARFAGGVPVDDFVYHDYALAVQNPESHVVAYELLIPRRTRYPTPPEFATRYYGDCPGMTEMRFRVCEVGRLGQAPVPWELHANGNRYWTPQGDAERERVLELNPADPPLLLRPAGRGTSPRLRVAYTINADRWLCTTVDDLVRRQPLRVNEPMVRLR
jgi:molecular chaperone DnaK (HSP70)